MLTGILGPGIQTLSVAAAVLLLYLWKQGRLGRPHPALDPEFRDAVALSVRVLDPPHRVSEMVPEGKREALRSGGRNVCYQLPPDLESRLLALPRIGDRPPSVDFDVPVVGRLSGIGERRGNPRLGRGPRHYSELTLRGYTLLAMNHLRIGTLRLDKTFRGTVHLGSCAIVNLVIEGNEGTCEGSLFLMNCLVSNLVRESGLRLKHLTFFNTGVTSYEQRGDDSEGPIARTVAGFGRLRLGPPEGGPWDVGGNVMWRRFLRDVGSNADVLTLSSIRRAIMLSGRHGMDWLPRLLVWLLGLTSDYGNSPTRAIGWLLGVGFVTFCVALSMDQACVAESARSAMPWVDGIGAETATAAVGRNLVLTVQPMVNPFAAFGGGEIVTARSWWFFAWSYLQTLLSAFLVVSAVLGVRRHLATAPEASIDL